MTNPTDDRLLVERDSLKAECIRLMDEVSRLKAEADYQLGRRQQESHKPPLHPACGKTLECGGTCYREPNHEGPCLCSGDMDGPGSCPA